MKNLKVSMKLLVGFSSVVVLSLIIGVLGIYGMSRLNQAQSDMYNKNLLAIEAMGDLRELFGNERNEFRNIFINAYFLDNDSFDLEGAIAKFDTYKVTADESFALYETTIDPTADESAYYSAKDTWTGLYAKMKADMFPMMREGKWEEAYALFTSSAANVIAPITSGLAKSTEQNIAWAAQADAEGGALFTTLTWALVIVLVIAAVSSMILALYISKLISKPLVYIRTILYEIGAMGRVNFSEEEYRQAGLLAEAKDEAGQSIQMLIDTSRRLESVGRSLERIAGGDLTEEITLLSEADTIGNSLRQMMDNLNNMFSEINSATSQVATGSKQIADGSQSLAQGSTEQAAAVQQLSSSIAEIAEKTKENSAMANRAATLANTIKVSAEKGNLQMDEMTSAVKEINEASQNISKVISVIDNIAFQTNILALNAAVEAARAGQHGKGFAVVAEEVRSLAAKSAEAAKDTGGLIANSMEKAELGARIAGETAASLVEIVSGINESTQLVGDIAKSSEEQSIGIAQINSGIDQVAQVVQQNSATAEESAAASQEMSGQSDMLQSMVAQFKIRSDNSSSKMLASAMSSSPAKVSSAPSEKAYSPDAAKGSYGKY